MKNRLKEEFDKNIPEIKFLEYPTIRSFYNYLHQEIYRTDTDSDNDSKKEIDPYETDDEESSKLKLRRKILGNIVDV